MVLFQNEGLSEQDISRLIASSLAVTTPDDAFKLVWPFIQWYFSPTLINADKLPDKPTLFVGNHSLFGIDGALLLPIIYHETGRFVRGMGDKYFFELSDGERLMNWGMILANPKVCSAMMQAGADLMVFPGGASEATKPEAEKYQLQWGNRYGFARMAAQHGYSITPFGIVGADDFYSHRIEGQDLLKTLPGKLLTQAGLTEGIREDMLPPIPSGLLGGLFPKPQPLYIAFGDSVEVADCRGQQAVPQSVLSAVREETADKINVLVSEMLELRSQNQDSASWLRRLLC
jgi:1-acyl-sn-glycerol-3-phosphate acyltransferase